MSTSSLGTPLCECELVYIEYYLYQDFAFVMSVDNPKWLFLYQQLQLLRPEMRSVRGGRQYVGSRAVRDGVCAALRLAQPHHIQEALSDAAPRRRRRAKGWEKRWISSRCTFRCCELVVTEKILVSASQSFVHRASVLPAFRLGVRDRSPRRSRGARRGARAPPDRRRTHGRQDAEERSSTPKCAQSSSTG